LKKTVKRRRGKNWGRDNPQKGGGLRGGRADAALKGAQKIALAEGKKRKKKDLSEGKGTNAEFISLSKTKRDIQEKRKGRAG